MPINVNLHLLSRKTLEFEGTLTPEEMELDGLDELVHARRPVQYKFIVEEMEKSILVQGDLRVELDCECARCLKAYVHPIVFENYACLIPLEGEEAAPLENDCVDLTPSLREDILLAFPQHPLCEPECGGLASPPLMKPKTTVKPAPAEKGSSVWTELDKLKL